MATTYHANFKTQEFRPSRPANAVAFQAGSDGAAASIAAELGNWTTGQLSALTKNVGGAGTAGPYPVGTRITCTAHVADSTGAVSRVRFRNVNPTVTEADIVALLTGVAGTGGTTITALGAPPNIPGTTNPIVSVLSVLFANKS